MSETEKGIDFFWAWICAQADGDDPRGDFIRDTRDLVRIGIDPDTRLYRVEGVVEKEYDRLRREYNKARPRFVRS